MSVESERHLLACLDEVLDAPEADRSAVVHARFGADSGLVRELERLLAVTTQSGTEFLTERAELVLQPVLSDLDTHSVSAAEVPTGFTTALAPRYSLLERIGSGGMASVYLAFDTALGRNVAIKSLRPELADGISQERFEREIAIAATIDHPRVVPVYDRGEADGLLYYVMRYVDGGSLRDLLVERPQLEIRRAIDVARDVAEALDAAHARGIVHRDIKPANILLDQHGAHVADFGVARLIDAAGRERLTRTGIALGTVAYMSPEQASSAAQVDGRSDVYALACVLYEMLAGEAPFTGPTQRDVMAKHLAAAIPDLTVVRATVTRAMQEVIAKALQKAPADRFSSATEFIDAFEDAWLSPDSVEAPTDRRANNASRVSVATRRSTTRARQTALTTAGVIVVGLSAWGLSLGRGTETPDSALHVVFPFSASGEVRLDVAQRLREALAEWTGIRVVDQFTLEGKVGAAGSERLDDRRAIAAARELGARRFVRGRLQPEGDFLRLVATLFDVDSGQLAEVPARVRGDLGDMDSVMAAVAERLLFRNVALDRNVEPSIGTANFAAREAYLAAHTAIREWDLAIADSQLFRAVNLDASYSQSLLWLAQVRFWREEPASRWSDYVERAIARGLTDRERTVALALRQWASDEIVTSCETWERAAAAKENDGLLWYSAHKCRFRDNVVIEVPSSQTRWQFRSSHHLALKHMERALGLTPTIYRGLRDNGFEQLRIMLKTREGLLRQGRSAGSPGVDFAAFPMLSSDTLAFTPIPVRELGLRAEAIDRFWPMIALALERQRQQFRNWAMTWASNYPQSAEAWEAVAVALETLGSASALDTIVRARRLAQSPADQQRISGTQAWMLVKFSIPSEPKRLRQARILIDSVLRYPPPQQADRRLLVSLAALTGRLSVAGENVPYLTDWPRRNAPAGINEVGARLLLHSALGGAAQELNALERSADSVLSLAHPEFQGASARKDIMGRAAALAFPSHIMSSLADTVLSDDLLFRSLQQWQQGQRGDVATTLAALRSLRRQIPPASVQFDKLLPEARLIALAEGVTEAIRWIDPTLNPIRASSYQSLLDPVRAAAFVGTMVFRADLAVRDSDPATAAKWAAVVAELWADCDPVLQPVRDRMRSLTR